MILRNLFHCVHLLFTWKTHCGLKFHFGQLDRSEICTEVSFTTPDVMWTLIMKLPHTKVKFYPEMKSQTGLSSLRVSCERALRNILNLLCQVTQDFIVNCSSEIFSEKYSDLKNNLNRNKTWWILEDIVKTWLEDLW